jgi:hypothetical protein
MRQLYAAVTLVDSDRVGENPRDEPLATPRVVVGRLDKFWVEALQYENCVITDEDGESWRVDPNTGREVDHEDCLASRRDR